MSRQSWGLPRRPQRVKGKEKKKKKKTPVAPYTHAANPTTRVWLAVLGLQHLSKRKEKTANNRP